MKKLLCLLLATCLLTSFKPKEITWVAIGDSITYLNDHPDETGNRVTKGYLSRVTEKLPNIHYVNQGHNGWTSGGIAEQIEKLGIVKADIYSVFLGTNDWWAGRPIGTLNDYTANKENTTIYGSFRIIVNKIRSLNPEAKIILITPMQRNDFIYILDHNNNAYGSYKDKNGQSLEAVANAIDSIAAYEKIPVVDLYHNSKLDIKNLVKFKRLKDPKTGQYKNYKYPESIGIPFDSKNDEYPYPADAVNYTYDGLHPSDKGDEVIAGELVKVMTKFD
jgi:lysophospholipase L1-like esterase